MTAMSMGASAGGSILSAFGATQKGKAQQQMYNYQAGLAQARAKIADQNRDYALSVGQETAAKYGIKARQEMGALRAKQGASGVDVGSGSAIQVREGQAGAARTDLETIQRNAARRAYGFEVEGAMDVAQAGMYTAAGVNARSASGMEAASSLISGASSVSSKWLQASQSGIFGGKASSGDIPYAPDDI